MRRGLLFLALLVSLPTAAWAGSVPYTGNLTDNGTPVNGNRYVALALYDAAIGGSVLYSQAESLAVVNGVYQTMINAPQTIWTGADRWLGVAINGSPELTPRVKIGWVPYADYVFHLSPFIFPAPANGRTVTSDQWTPVDSVIVTTTNPGTVSVSLLGYIQWTGSVTPAPLQLDLNKTTPTTFAIYYNPPSGYANPLTMTTFTTVPAGQTKIYLWAKLTSLAQTYFVQSQRFQALYFPD